MNTFASVSLWISWQVSLTSGFGACLPRGFRTSVPFLNAATLEPEITIACSSGTVIINDDPDFIKPEPDQRKYRAIRLSNGLKCLLVSSPEPDVEAAAVHVKAGHMDDPPNRPGIAHFHEHRLFRGKEKYPDEKQYEAFLNQNVCPSKANH